MEAVFNMDIPRETFLKRWAERSVNSEQLAIKALKWFDKYIKTLKMPEDKLIAQLKKVSNQPEFYQFLDNFVQYISSNKLSPRSTRTYFSFVKSYLRSKGFRIYREDVKQFIHYPKIVKESKEPVTMDQITTLYNRAGPKMKAIISTSVSSGMRAGETLQIKVSDIKGNKIHIRAETTKTKADRITYVSKQAHKDMHRYVKGKPLDAYVFVRNYKQALSVLQLEKQFSILREQASLTKQYRLTSYHHITIHRLRAFCKTMASEVCGQDFAEGLIGHEGYLSTYYALPETQRLQKYKNLEPFLTIPETKKELEDYQKNMERFESLKANWFLQSNPMQKRSFDV